MRVMQFGYKMPRTVGTKTDAGKAKTLALK